MSVDYCKSLTLLDYRELKTVSIHDGAIHMPDDVFGKWISHPIAEVRLAGMFLSVHSTSVTKPLTGGVLKSLRRNLTHLHTETDANLRREIHGYTQKLFDRLRASTATLSKSALKTRPSTTSRLSFPTSCFDSGTPHLVRERREPLLESLSFISWYKQFLIEELRSTANYQRRITALQCIIIVLRSGLDPGVPHAQLSKAAQGQLQWAHELHVADDRLIRVLLDLILDPFDDIRASTIAVLQLCIATLSDCKRRSVIALIPAFIDRAELAMLKTGRADQADGVARAYSLLYSTSNAKLSYGPDFDRHPSSDITVFKKLCYQLSSTLEIARDDLSRAVDGRPVHGTFAALRSVIQTHSCVLH